MLQLILFDMLLEGKCFSNLTSFDYKLQIFAQLHLKNGIITFQNS